MDPLLISRRTGRTIAIVLALGFGGGTLLLGLATSLAAALRTGVLWPVVQGYSLAALPFFVGGALVAMCRRELWFLPEHRAFRMLTYRPWRLRRPRVEQASVDEYRAVCLMDDESEGAAEDEAGEPAVVALVTREGDKVPLREFRDAADAKAFALELAEATGLSRTAASDGPA